MMSYSLHGSKPPTPSPVLSKSNLIQWLRNTLVDIPNTLKIQDLGTGVVFCKLLSNYYSNVIPANRIISNPKNEYENTSNLKLLQNALVQLKINIPIDVSKIAKMKFQQNWALINALYKHFNAHNELEVSVGNQDSRSVQGIILLPPSQIKTPKRTFQQAFTNDSQAYFRQNKQYNTEYYQPNYQRYEIMKAKPPIIKDSGMPNHSSLHGPFHLPIGYSLPQFQYPPSMFNTITPKHSTGKLYKENSFMPSISSHQFNQLPMSKINSEKMGISSPMKGKWSVSSQFFQTNNHAIIDRVKQILLKSSHDTEKIRQVKMLMNIPLDDDTVKVQEELLANHTGIPVLEITARQSKQSLITPNQNQYEKS